MKNRYENIAPRAHLMLALGFCLLVLFALMLVGCGGETQKEQPMIPEAPTELTLDDGMLSWSAPAGAQSYLVHIGEEQYETTTPSFDLFDCLRNVGVYKIYVQAVGTEATALSPLSEPIGYSVSMPKGLTLHRFREDAYTIKEADPALVKGRIRIPERVDGILITDVATEAFRDCTELTEVVLPDTITHIASGIFLNCSALTDATIPSEAYHTSASGLVPYDIDEVPKDMFKGCTSLTSITAESEEEPAGLHGGRLVLPQTVRTITAGAFADCTALTSVVFSSSLQDIAMNAFAGCTALTSLTIPPLVTSISYGASIFFETYPELPSLSITIDEDNAIYRSEGNCVIRKIDHTLVLGFSNSVIPDDVTAIGRYAFTGCTSLTSVAMPDGVTEIGERAFAGCTGLTNMTLPDGITEIGNYAFAGCTGLTNMTLPDGVTEIGDNAFAGCTGLTRITIPKGVTSIGWGAFRDCSALAAVTLPDGLKTLGLVKGKEIEVSVSVFDNCSSLTALEIPASVTYIGRDVVGRCERLQRLTVAAGNAVYRSEGNCIIRRADDALVACGATDTIPAGVRSLLPYSLNSFAGRTLTIPEGVTEIGEYAVYGTRLCEVRLPTSLQTIGDYAFRHVRGGPVITFYLPREVGTVPELAIPNQSVIYTTASVSAVPSGWSIRYVRCVVYDCTFAYDGAYTYLASLSLITVEGERAKNLPAQLDCTQAGYSPFRNGYTFAGFSTVEGGTTAEYRGTPDERSALEAMLSGTRLYAVWVADEPMA